MNNDIVALIAEGNTEQAILDVLVEHDALIFAEKNLLADKVIRCRNGRRFAKKYLNKSFGQKVVVYRILDSRNEKFVLPKEYMHQVSKVVDLSTRPEIEILFIIFHGEYRKFTNRYSSRVKPSEYVKANYSDLKKVKSYRDNYEFWNEHYDELITILKQYKKSHSHEHCIADLLKANM